MEDKARPLFFAAIATLFVSCSATSMKKTWKAPDYTAGPVGKVAVLVVEDRLQLRQAMENRFSHQLKEGGEPAFVTYDLLSLQQVKEDKQASAARFREAGSDAILIVRLVDSRTYSREVQATPSVFVPMTTGFETYGWYDYYSVAFMDMGTVWNSLEQRVYLDSSLYELKSGRRLWSCLTETVLKEDMDRLEALDVLVAKVVAALRKDGMVR
jgi:hypothetical protein